MGQKREKLRLTLEHFRFVGQYAGVLFVALTCPRLPKTVWLLPGLRGPRPWLMLWAVLLMAAAAYYDGVLRRASEKDKIELEQHKRDGGLNRSTYLALGTLLFLLLDAVAVVHVYAAYFKSGSPAPLPDTTLRTAVAAVGCVLYIYGRRLPEIRVGSFWGIRTQKTAASPQAWAEAHTKAAKALVVSGLTALLASTFFSGTGLLSAGVLCIGAALIVIYLAGIR